MPPTKAWHNRFVQQAGWTAEIRRYLTADIPLDRRSRLLDVGCGTGALFPGVKSDFPGSLYHGLDLDRGFLTLAYDPLLHLCQGNALALPYAADAFDLVYCHFFLLWIDHPARALAEMVRVAKAGSYVLAFAEPDYGGRIDYPPELVDLGKFQVTALADQGADPLIGRKLAQLFLDSGLQEIQVGILGASWSVASQTATDESEIWVLRRDLQDRLPAADLERYLWLDQVARSSGERILFVPTFYARGRKPPQA